MNNHPSGTAIDPTADAKWLDQLPFIAGGCALVLIAFYAWTFHNFPLNENPGAWGTFGDFMGGLLNPLISLFTLVVAVSVWKLQKTELLETRKAVEDQGKTAEQQRQEQRFFDLLNIYHRTIDSTAYNATRDRRFKGKDALTEILGSFISFSNFEQRYARGDAPDTQAARDEFTHEMQNEWISMERSSYLGSYLRVVSHILSESEALLGEQHFRYVKLFQVQLDHDELTLLSLSMWLDSEGGKMIPLAEKYGLLKHLQPGKLRECLEKHLPPGVFGNVYGKRHQTAAASEECHAD